MTKFVLKLIVFFSFTYSSVVFANTADKSDRRPYIDNDVVVDPAAGTRTNLYHYGYNERVHSLQETLSNVGLVYGLTWVVYPLVQPKVFKVKDGFNQYKNNFGKLVFDKDEPIWNFFVHPISGSQLYLLYRAQGYSRMSSLGLTTISSTLFEISVEILTEPASVQDLYMTPILGSVLGLGIETLSMSLLNSGTVVGKIVAHIINPATILPLYEGRTLIIPKFEQEDKGAMVKMELTF